MPIKKGQILNPKGNPNIGEISKTHATGPKTAEGRLRQALVHMKGGEYSKIIQRYRKACNSCPLGKKVTKRVVNGKDYVMEKPAICPHYKEGSRTCKMPGKEMVAILRSLDTISKHDGLEMQRQLVMKSLTDAELNREFEMLDKGHPGFYTEKFNEQALKYQNELNKMIHGEKRKIEADITQNIKSVDMNQLIRDMKDDIDAEDEKETEGEVQDE